MRSFAWCWRCERGAIVRGQLSVLSCQFQVNRTSKPGERRCFPGFVFGREFRTERLGAVFGKAGQRGMRGSVERKWCRDPSTACRTERGTPVGMTKQEKANPRTEEKPWCSIVRAHPSLKDAKDGAPFETQGKQGKPSSTWMVGARRGCLRRRFLGRGRRPWALLRGWHDRCPRRVRRQRGQLHRRLRPYRRSGRLACGN